MQTDLKHVEEDVRHLMDNHLLEVQDLLRNNGILISFSGQLSQKLIEEYGEAVKTYLETQNRPKNEIFHVFSIFIEQTQNIKNYCSTKDGTPVYESIAQSSIVTIGEDSRGRFISSGNLVAEEDLRVLTAHIDSFVRLGKEELKALYKQKLKAGQPENGSGAGIGLIDMARKVSIPLEYTVTRLDGNLSFFTLKAVV